MLKSKVNISTEPHKLIQKREKIQQQLEHSKSEKRLLNKYKRIKHTKSSEQKEVYDLWETPKPASKKVKLVNNTIQAPVSGTSYNPDEADRNVISLLRN